LVRLLEEAMLARYIGRSPLRLPFSLLSPFCGPKRFFFPRLVLIPSINLPRPLSPSVANQFFSSYPGFRSGPFSILTLRALLSRSCWFFFGPLKGGDSFLNSSASSWVFLFLPRLPRHRINLPYVHKCRPLGRQTPTDLPSFPM